MGVVATWLVSVLAFATGIPYPLSLRGYILVDMSVHPTPSTSGERGITSS